MIEWNNVVGGERMLVVLVVLEVCIVSFSDSPASSLPLLDRKDPGEKKNGKRGRGGKSLFIFFFFFSLFLVLFFLLTKISFVGALFSTDHNITQEI